MKKFNRTIWLLALALCPLLGCDALLSVLTGDTVRVSLVNDSDFDITVSLFIYDEQLVPEFLITELGDESVFFVPAGQTVVFFRICEELQAIMIDDADLLVDGGFGPEANSDVLRDDDDFSCGNTITFTFDHSAAILDFDVTSSVFGF